MPAKKPPVNAQTLDQFSVEVDEHLGYAAGFADAVRRLASVRRRMAVMDERRKLAYREIETRFERLPGAVMIVTHGSKRQVIRRAATVVKYGKAAPSAAVKKADKVAWEKARVLKDRVIVSPPDAWEPPEAVGKLTPIPTTTMDDGMVVSLYQHRIWTGLAALRDEETAAKDDLAKIAAGCGWDGTAERFSDGWAVALKQLMYDSDRLRMIDPVLWDQLATVTEHHYGGQLLFKDYDRAVAEGWLDEDIEIDEIDGD